MPGRAGRRTLGPDRATLRATAPRVRPAADDSELRRDEAATTARLPSLALRTARAALRGRPRPHPGAAARLPRRDRLRPVPRPGQVHAPGWAAGQCNGPLRLAGPHAAPDCRWCGALAQEPGPGGWRCPHCGHDKLRAIVTGAARTAEELGRAFPGVKVRTSGGDLVLPRVPASARPGDRDPGRGAARPTTPPRCCLTAGRCSSRPSLRAGEETLRRWLAAAALVRPDGTVLVHADAALPATQALIRWDPVTFAERDLAERAELGFPPAVRMAAVTGEPAAVATVLAGLGGGFEVLGPSEVLGPVPVDAAAQPGDDQVARPGPGAAGGGRARWPGRCRRPRPAAAPARRAAASASSSTRRS